jgi:hypothetical protein
MVLQLGDPLSKIKDFLDIPAEASHHGRFLLTCCFSVKNRSKQTPEVCSINCQISW